MGGSQKMAPQSVMCFVFKAQGNMLTIKHLCGLSTYKNITVPLALDFVWQVNTDPQICVSMTPGYT